MQRTTTDRILEMQQQILEQTREGRGESAR
jgi:hypothetical protein